MQSYKILHFLFPVRLYWIFTCFFVSYSKSVQGQSTLTNLQKKSIVTGFPQRLEPPHSFASGEGEGDLNPSCCLVTICGEFLKDSQAFFFPMIRFFQMEEGRATILGEKEVCDSHTTKTNVRSNPLKFPVCSN